MKQNKYSDLLLDQTKDLIWTVDSNLFLVYANKAYLNLMKELTGEEKGLNTPVLVEGFGEGGIEKWESYYQQAFLGEYFEAEEHFYHPETKEMQYGHIALTPIRDESGEILTVVCRSTDITSVIRQKDYANQLMDASLDVFCTIDEAGNFVFLSAASADHWGYHPEELIGKPFRNFIIEEDVEKTDLVAAEIMAGKEFKSFSNRYRKKNGDIAYNLWSVRWDYESKLMYCVARDAKDKIEEEAEKELLSQISLSFNNENELIPAANRLCENLYDFGKFDFIELWCPNMEQTQIKLMGHSTQNQEFYKLELSEVSFQKNEGMPGKVWGKGKQLLWDEKQIKKYFVRKKGASHLELQAILGIPLTFNGELVGVLLIGTKRNLDYLKQHSSTLSQLEKFIGSEINRKRLENNVSNVFDAIPEILCITDFEGRFLKINNAGCVLLGYATDEVLFHSLDEFTLKEDKGKFEQKIKDIKKDTSDFTFENRFLSKDGQVIWLSWNCNTALEEGLVYASAKNITAEVQLRELNAQAGSMAKIGSWEINLDKNTVFWSKIVHQLHETNPDSFIPDLETAIDFYREDFRPLVHNSIENSMTTGEGFDFEAVIITKKLKERWVRAIGNVEIVNGKANRIYGSFQDITDRKGSELRLQSFANNLPGVAFQYFIYPDGTDALKYVTDGAQKVWGFDADGVMKDNNLVWMQIELGGDIDLVKKSIMHSVETKSEWKAQWRYMMPNNELHIHAGYGSPNFLPDGTMLFNSLILDITQEFRSEELLKQASEMAKIGSWELNLVDQENDSIYWSPMTRKILEVDERHDPSFARSFDFYEPESKVIVQKAIDQLIESGTSFDLELIIQTSKGNSKWVRCIGKAEIIEEKCVRIFGSFQDIHEHKTVELQLKSLTDNLPGVIFQYLLRPDGTDQILYASEGSYKVWGLSPQECVDSPEKIWQQIEAGGHLDKMVESIRESAENLTPWFSEWLNVSLDGTKKWYEGRGLPQKMKDGSVLWNSITLDITERKELEEKYQQSQAERATILESISDAFYALDSDWNFTYFNREAQNLLKKSADEVLGGNIWKIFAPAKGTILEEVYRRVASMGQSENFEYHYPGDGCWYELSVYASSGGVTSYFKNIDERKKATQELERAYKEKDEILESIGDAFFTLDRDWTVTYWNKQAVKLLQVPKEEIVGKNLWDVFADAIDSDFYLQYHFAMETGETVRFEEKYVTQGKWFEVSVYPSETGLSIYFTDVTLRKEADERLTKANERFEKVTEATNDAIWDWDIINDTFYRSQNIYKFFGKEVPTTLTSKEFWNDSFHPDDLKTVKESISKALKDKQTQRWEMEYRILNEKGNTVHLIDKGLIIRDASGKAIRMIGAMTDITELKRANIELTRQAEFINAMTDNQLAAIVACNAEGELTLFNKTAKEWHGVDAMNVTQEKWAENYDLYNKDGINLLDKSEIPLIKAFNGEKVKNDEIIIKKKNEKARIVLCNGSSFHDNNGEKLGAVVIMTDITDRKESESKLIENENYLRTILDNEPECVKVLNSKGELLSMNPAGLAMIEADNEQQVLGQRMTDLVNKEYQLGFNQLSKEVFKGNSGSFEFEITGLKGGCRWLETHAVPLKDSTGKIVNLLGVTRDITERKKTERELLAINEKLSIQTKELQRSNEELEQFAFITSHDLQEPLRMISSFMDQLKRKYADQLDDKALQYIHFATDGAKRMKQIILDLLLYSRANKPSEQIEEVNLNEIISEYTQLRRKLIAEKNASITFDVLPILEINKAPITQIVHCLLDNALRYVQENVPPRIEIYAKEKETAWEFAIKDNGIGIDEKFYDKIFIIFQRLHNRSLHDGTGIGLSIAKRSVEFLGGKIWLKSTVGEGSIFYFTIAKTNNHII